MRWIVLGTVMLGTWTAAVFLTIRRVGGLRRLDATATEPGFPSGYMIGALLVSVAAALVINPASERSFDLSDWLRTAAIVASTVWFGRRVNRDYRGGRRPN